ncbi:hypothetical protein [Stackebrandtia soli]|uniref:hypothetical protein n=1 Tax=Stackebrandtia soli TaxID=1892856 RepID=UPI0039E76CB2
MNLRKAGRLAASVAIAAGLTLGAAACNDDPTSDNGDKDNTTTPLDPQAAVAAGFENLQSKTYSMTMTAGDVMSGTFDVDMANTAMQGTMTMDAGATDPSMAGMGEMSFEMISIDKDVWIKLTGEAFEAVEGMTDSWLHTTAESEDMADMAEMDMTKMTQQMMDSLKDVKETGDNTYTGTVDPAAMDDTLGSDVESDAPIEVTVKLNDDGLLESFSTTLPKAMEGKDLPLEVSFSNYGKAMEIAAPPADQVKELSELLGGGTF